MNESLVSKDEYVFEIGVGLFCKKVRIIFTNDCQIALGSDYLRHGRQGSLCTMPTNLSDEVNMVLCAV